MKVTYCSDLHLEFSDYEIHNVDNADVLILAGDIMPISRLKTDIESVKFGNISRFLKFIDQVTNLYKHVIWVMGNHEYYGADITELSELKQAFKCYSNLYILENEIVKLDGVTFIGGTMWTDLNKNDPSTKYRAAGLLNDFHYITENHEPFNVDYWYSLHQQFMQFITDFFTSYQSEDPVVVVTHHSPTFETIDARYKGSFIMNGLYCSSLEEFILDNPSIKYWIHGHLHGCDQFDLDTCKIRSNTRGYPSESCYKQFDLQTFDI